MTEPIKFDMQKAKQSFLAGKKQQEIDDMQLLGAIIEQNGGEVRISESDLLKEYWVSRESDLVTDEIVLKAISQ